MVQFSILPGTSLPVLESTVAGAARFAEAVRSAQSARAVSAHAGSATVSTDRQLVVASGRFAAEANARSAGIDNATVASSLLQTADAALAEIATKLDTLDSLAQQAYSNDRSALERAQFDTEFQSIKAEIDEIAATTAFNGTALLQGGSGAGGELEISFKVSTGIGEEDSIIVSIAPASVSDLSSGLDGGSIQTQAGAATAIDDVEAAQDSVGAIRAGIAGGFQRFSAAMLNSRSVVQNLETTRDTLTSPTVAVDMSQLLALRIADEGGIELTDRAVNQLQKLLISLDQTGDRLPRPEGEPEGGSPTQDPVSQEESGSAIPA